MILISIFYLIPIYTFTITIRYILVPISVYCTSSRAETIATAKCYFKHLLKNSLSSRLTPNIKVIVRVQVRLDV